MGNWITLFCSPIRRILDGQSTAYAARMPYAINLYKDYIICYHIFPYCAYLRNIIGCTYLLRNTHTTVYFIYGSKD